MRVSALVGWVLIGLYLSVFGYSQDLLDISVSVPPGDYASDVTLKVEYPSPSYQVVYRFTDSSDPAYTPYRIPVVLSALEGEDRRYELEYQLYDGKRLLRTGKVLYRIDKRPPLVPIPSVESGEYFGKVSLTFQKESDADVYVAVYRGEKPTFSRWDGVPISLESGPVTTQITLLYYARDKVGNSSRVEARALTLHPQTPPLDAFWKIHSPTEGSFLNPQVLWIEHRGYEWIRYRINDAPSYQTYREPLLIDTTGSVKLEVSAKRLFSSTIETKVIIFRQENRIQDLPLSGVYSLEDEVTIPLGKGKYRYNLEDRVVELYDPESPDRLSLYPIQGHNRFVVIRLKPTGGTIEGEYRYLVELKGEVPGDVGILFDETRVHREKPIVTLNGRPGSQLYYTLDGSLPTTSSFLYEGPFEVPLPPNGEGFLTLRARARIGQRWGPVTEKFLEYDTIPPPQPTPQHNLENPSGYASIELPFRPDVEGIYETAWGGKEPTPLSITSPILGSKKWIRVPYGYSGVAKLRIGYRDRAGNITEASKVIVLSFDRVPPPVPEIRVKDRVVTLSGEGSLFYRILETSGSLEGSEVESEAFLPYAKPIELPAPEGRVVQYQIFAYSQDEAGNRSEISMPLLVSFDRRVPATLVPPSQTLPSIPITNKDFVLSFQDPRGDLELYYTFTEDGSEPPDPTTKAMKGASILRFYGQEGKRILYTVKVWARYRGSIETGQVQTFKFVIDRDPPKLPKVEGMNPPIRNRGALIRFILNDPTDTVFYRVISGNEGKDLPWIPYTEPFLLDVEEGKENTFFLSYRVVDDAGNSIELPQPIKLVIDKKPPLAPVVEVQKEISLKTTEGKIYYELTTDGSLPPIPTVRSSQYVKSLPRTLKEGSFISLSARTRDEAGNWSEMVYLTDVPALPPFALKTPTIHSVPLGSFTLVTWEERAEVTMEGLDPQEGFTLRGVKNPWILDSRKEREVLVQIKDLDGKNPVKVKLVPPPAAIPVRVSGGEKGEYSRGIQLQNMESNAILRYEISTGNLPPRKVDALSPRLERPLVLDSLPEETVYYRIQVQNYSKNHLPVSPAQEFTVKIDRTPPPPPELTGLEAGASYGQDITIAMQAKEGNTFFTLDAIEEGQPIPPLPKENQFKAFEKPISTSVPEGSSRTFWVSAFTRDSVGNISRQIPRWSFTVDKQYIYVIEGKGGQGNGTRVSPYTNLETALEAALKGSRTRIRLATGTYRITKPILIKRDLYLFGGFDRNGWKPEGGISKILFDTGAFRSTGGNSYFTVEGVTFKIDRCQIEGGDGKGRSVFLVRNGTLEFSSGSVAVLGKDRVLDQGNGSVTFDRSDFQSTRLEADALVMVMGGSFRSKESRYSFQRSEQGASLLLFQKASVVLESATLIPGEAETSMGIDAKESNLQIRFSSIQTGGGTLAAYGLRHQGGTLQMERSEILHTPTAYISIGIGLFQSKGEIISSTFRMGGRYGAQALQVRSSELILRESLVEGNTTEDYLYYGTFEDSSLRFVGNVFRKGVSSEITAYQLMNSRMEAEKNTFEFGTSKRGFSGFILKGKSDLVLRSNDLIAPDPKGILFVLPRDEIRVLVTENRFNVKGAYRETRQGGRRILLSTLKDLEASSSDQVRFEKNQN
ncbi:MAG: chitobiase/beta-hexosaminidase C-terminal domain-containing protein [Spirochaetes bacterium]|nr:chitobiase/beta-hexosaminidase C-terminal domain-containing protein [Spirochaetota bacterium]